ncbi:hypothetical protein BABINDRAFT_163467 [Babjeviella inositovora NRRL Y-12698]|uniref:Amino acid transporter transmembrane domain-containing protein n=1 Tax=Babjeviella inositovora NRRL Y-12698 TaxID=984486 RepID=A0A1E3QKC1_9ASCO|nr:uncharacterized protein BABINDRAFT_163467 [Babjeviella inositovora NRRL Y-12698]ODQ77447.1 hypothetical protein BABINDRAFT_163467 [Babjeviella inositovora NRRL Y-12698]
MSGTRTPSSGTPEPYVPDRRGSIQIPLTPSHVSGLRDPLQTLFREPGTFQEQRFNEDSFRTGDFSAKGFKSQVLELSFRREVPVQVDIEPSSLMVKLSGGFEAVQREVRVLQRTGSAASHGGLSMGLREPSASATAGIVSEGFPESSSPTRREPSRDSGDDPLSHDSGGHGLFDAPPFMVTINPVVSPRRASPIDLDHPDPKLVEAVERHLVDPSPTPAISGLASPLATSTLGRDFDSAFDSLQSQGGDMTRELYNWTARNRSQPNSRRPSVRRANSVGSRASSHPANEIRVPGGFRRLFITARHEQQARHGRSQPPPNFLTRNFVEFLALYGHFAGEELSDSDSEDEESLMDEPLPLATEEDHLLRESAQKRMRQQRTRLARQAGTSTGKTLLLLLKAFIGTGVLFLPRGYFNAGWLVSLSLLIFFSCCSFYSFTLLMDVKASVRVSSFGDLGLVLFGSWFRRVILTAIILSQIGFASAYIVFVAENLRALAQSLLSTELSIRLCIGAQVTLFLPLCLTRQIGKLSVSALIANAFIFLGIIYVYCYSGYLVFTRGVAPDVAAFNAESWTIFVGTAIFSYEGIGLLLPIEAAMEKPEQFRMTLTITMLTVTFIFVTLGGIGYFAFGSAVETVVLLNFPQDSLSVHLAQLLYALAILLSTPLQLFPAIKILEHGVFGRSSGKLNPSVKWSKNAFRSAVVLGTTLIAIVGANDLDKFVSFIGSFACIPLLYIFPPLLHLRCMRQNALRVPLAMVVVDIAVLAFGCIMMVYTLVENVRSWM